MIASASASSWRKRHPRRFCFGVASLALVLAVILSTALGLVLSRRNANGKSTNTAAQPFNRNTTASSTEFELIKERRRKSFALAVETDDLVAATASSTFVATLTTAGQWPDVDYTSGCDAQRANWPAQEHWNRIIALASVWSGLNPSAPPSSAGSPALLATISKAMDWWFAHDLTLQACIGKGGDPKHNCPCGSPGMWNPNWFANTILIPNLVSTACLLLDNALTDSQRTGCELIPKRVWDLSGKPMDSVGYLTGANRIGVMQNSVSMALYMNSTSILLNAMAQAMGVISFSDEPQADGIHRDGSFLQHKGILYQGNYGKDLLNAFVQLQANAMGTSVAANASARAAFARDVQASEWMIYTDTDTQAEHWDLNVVGRFIAFPTSDLQATSDINVNITKLAAATADFEGDLDLKPTVQRLLSNGTAQSANSGQLNGNRAFWASDFQVHRRSDYIQTIKLLSTRSTNSEHINGANPYGFNLGIGSLYTYASGIEYKDIQAAWDWNLIPGTTTTLLAKRPKSDNVTVTGTKSFVGSASDGWLGTTAMDFVDPRAKKGADALAYRKAVFFLNASTIVTLSSIKSKDPVIAVLDNRRLSTTGRILVDGQPYVESATADYTPAQTLWHDSTGYTSLSPSSPLNLTLFSGKRTGNWSEISTSTAGVSTVSLFSAYTTIPPAAYDTSFSYAIIPSTDIAGVQTQSAILPIKGLTKDTSGVAGEEYLSLVFWTAGQTANVPLSTIGWPTATSTSTTFDVTSTFPAIFLFTPSSPITTTNDDANTLSIAITLSDPTQLLSHLAFIVSIAGWSASCASLPSSMCSITTATGSGVKLDVPLPQGGEAGKSVTVVVGWKLP